MFTKSVWKTTRMVYSNFRFSSAWLKAQIQAAGRDTTLAVVVHQDQIRDGSLDASILPAGLSGSLEFRQDLNLSSAYWFYQGSQPDQMRRILLLQKKADKTDAKPADIRKSFRTLGVTACQQLQAKKASDVKILVTKQVAADEDLLGVFENSFVLANFENSHKRPKQPNGDAEEKKDEVDKDARTERINKAIDSYEILTEDEKAAISEKVKF